MVLATRTGDKNYFRAWRDKRRSPVALTADEIARQARSRRRQLEWLRRMIAEREGRDDGR